MLTDDSLHGRVVLSNDGLRIGEVTRLLVDPQTFRIEALEVRVNRSIADRVGLAHGMLRGPSIQIPTAHVQSIGDAIILSIPADALRTTEPEPAQAQTEPARGPTA